MPSNDDHYYVNCTSSSSSSSWTISTTPTSGVSYSTIIGTIGESEWIQSGDQFDLSGDFTVDLWAGKREAEPGRQRKRKELYRRWTLRNGPSPEDVLGVLWVERGRVHFDGDHERAAAFILEDFLWSWIQDHPRWQETDTNTLELAFGTRDPVLIVITRRPEGGIDYKGPLHRSAVSLFECLRDLVANRINCLKGESLSLEDEFFSRKAPPSLQPSPR